MLNELKLSLQVKSPCRELYSLLYRIKEKVISESKLSSEMRTPLSSSFLLICQFSGCQAKRKVFFVFHFPFTIVIFALVQLYDSSVQKIMVVCFVTYKIEVVVVECRSFDDGYF